MSGSPYRYLTEPSLLEFSTTIAHAEPLLSGGFAIACRETIFRPEGGGQPRDYGTLEVGGNEYEVTGLRKAKGLVHMHVAGLEIPPGSGMPVTQRVDSIRRDRLCRTHTLQHIISAEAARMIPEGTPCGTGIEENASGGWVRLEAPPFLEEQKFQTVIQMVEENVRSAAPVLITRASSVDEARVRFGNIFRLDPSVILTGKVRVVVIQGVDANCCSGVHHYTSDIGPYEIRVNHIPSTAGMIELRYELLT